MNHLQAKILDAHGGMNRWNEYCKVEATIVSGGGFFSLKGIPQDSAPRRMTGWLHEERSSVLPYGAPDQHNDGKGRIRYHHFGEGEYGKSEQVIQELLRENGATGLNASTVGISADGAEAPPGDDVRSPETYAGYARAEGFASPGGLAKDSTRNYSLPARPALNQWGLGEVWNVGAESAVLQESAGKIVFRFHSRDFHMVLAPQKGGRPVRFKVRLDGAAPGDDHGVDSNADGAGEIWQPRMYQLIRQKGPIQDRTFEIEFLDPGVRAFSFTFG